MKYSFLSIMFLLSFVVVKAQPMAPSANDILKEAYQQAAKENKKVFVMFHASWCGWCHKMDKSMNDPVCKKYFDDSYVIKHLVVDEAKDKKDLENPGANELRLKYKGDGLGIPFWLLFDKDGKLLSDSKMRKEGDGPEKGDNIGCPASEAEVAAFIEILKKTSSINQSQVEIVRKRFRENEK